MSDYLYPICEDCKKPITPETSDYDADDGDFSCGNCGAENICDKCYDKNHVDARCDQR